jgi:DNA-binding response OmpR family regulator
VPVDAEPVTIITISVGGGGIERERVLAALRDLIAVAGPAAVTVGESPPAAAAPVPDGTIRLDPAPRTATRDGFPLPLSRLEYDLLLFLAAHPRQVFSRGQLQAQVWGHTHATARTVDVHVSRLRHKLGDPDLITTVYGLGYRLADDAPITIT